ncbi:chemotaxis protein [Hylemonella gracilis str. Niagara R]|uniref:Chemotaxis protein n=1 Tax=Hylemonella gracilis str. Niagara R TaxID=1458275 RepID=A0A016XE38_9BURK|nr:PAS domain-containing methyl-accepting chemotaxis protein [Hylemonella gracilis]EYC49852.1 chemotaxis protein [Hylemonella gracilis str. Niagara R]
MRLNLPVTQNGYTFPADQTLISITDLKGRMTYCNTNFASVSGYTVSELMGQPHNLVRHPDMPEEAFRDLWETIQNGRPWTALVKNRRKNGDYYWVRANATPMRDGERIMGYLSVRTRASDEEIAAAEALYATMRAEAAAGRRVHVLHHGEVRNNSLMGRLWRWLRPELRGNYFGAMLVTALIGPVLVHLGAPPWAGTAAAIVAAIVFGFYLVRIGIKPLQDVIETANQLAAGDLTRQVRVTSKGEIGQLQLALAQLAVSVRTVVRDVRHEVANLLGSAREIASGNADMSARTESQASSLEQTAAAMDQINGTIQQTSKLAEEGAGVARETAGVAQRSHEVVQSVASTMDEIAESSRRINDIIQVIEGIAFQTNILALNAAVEAARAGEQGRGFAVVAAEVRTLAGRTAEASKEIKRLIEESRQRVELGGQRAVDARGRMDGVMESVGRVTVLLDQINTAAREQASGAAQINSAVSHLDGITQQNAAMVEELAASAKSLNDQVGMVHNTIRVFRLTAQDVTLAEVDAVALRKQGRGELTADEGPAYAPPARIGR